MNGRRRSARFLATTALLLVLPLCFGCEPRPEPTNPDDEAPVVTLQVRGQSFSSNDTPRDDACVKVNQFPVSMSVSTSDSGGGGIDRVVVRVLPGTIADASAAPDSASLDLVREGPTHVLTITPRPPSGSVQPNLLVSFTVDRFSGVVVASVDTAGNVANLFQVDVREAGDPVICRGDGPG